MNKTSQALDSKTYTEVETHEVEAIVSTPYMTELIYEYTEDEQTLELFQMPQLSSGRYIHDFEVIFKIDHNFHIIEWNPFWSSNLNF